MAARWWWAVPAIAVAGAVVMLWPAPAHGPSRTPPSASALPAFRKAPPGFLAAIIDTVDPATKRYGYTFVDATPSQLSAVSTGQRALVWLGGYDDSRCAWNWTDTQLRTTFANLPKDARVAGYFVADEPNSDGHCPAAARQVQTRSALVRALDPDRTHFTLVNVDDPTQFGAFRDSTDVLSTDPYPCHVGKPCDWSQIPDYVNRLRAAGVKRYMGMLQAFSGGDWRWPTAAELTRMIAQWQRSDWIGELTFSWSYAGGSLRDHPDLLAVLGRLNP
ncbi:hypothetical protein [Fodinicola acaciae]|uniref:hypothetical protein n=1 Tax=Fodinicola acaciae TaxID=2681555 RepID=UPI0013D08669|nr:hypothetical protein [Fodinicola acaciae]